MKIYKLEFHFDNDFDINKEFSQHPYGMTLMLQLSDIAKIIQPAFKKAEKIKQEWITNETNPNANVKQTYPKGRW